MVKDYSDFVKPIKKIFRALIKADYKTIELNGWASAEHAERVVDGSRKYHFMVAYDNAWPPRKKPEKPPKGLYWLIVPHDENIKDDLKEALLIDTLPHDTTRFPNASDPSCINREDYFYHLSDVIDGKTPIPNSTWGMHCRLWTKVGMSGQSLILYASIKDHSLTFKIEDIDP